jgi:hypothetical protein
MPDEPATTSPQTPQPPARKPRAKRTEISRDTLDAIDLADKCSHAATEDDNMTFLLKRDWTAEEQATLLVGVVSDNKLVREIKVARTVRKTLTQEESDARKELLGALDPILAGAKRSFSDGAAERALFGVGGSIGSNTTAQLYRLALDTHKYLTPGETESGEATPAKYTLKGVLPEEITKLGELGKKYKNADFAQANALLDAAQLLDLLNQHVNEVLNPLRRELQLAAEQAWPYREPTNRSKRMAFGLPANRPMTE